MDEQNLDEMKKEVKSERPKGTNSSKNAIENIPRTYEFPEYQLIAEEKCEVITFTISDKY